MAIYGIVKALPEFSKKFIIKDYNAERRIARTLIENCQLNIIG